MSIVILIVVLAISFGVRYQFAKKRNNMYAARVLPLLQQYGPMNLAGVCQGLGVHDRHTSNLVSIALSELVGRGQLVTQPLPPGTSLLARRNVTVYAVRRT